MANKDKSTLEHLERNPTFRISKIFYTKPITTKQEYADYIAWEYTFLKSVFNFEDVITHSAFMENFSDPRDSYMMTCRRWGKSQKVAIVLLLRLLNLPWFNACHSTKYDKRIGEIAQLYKNAIDILANSGMVDLAEKFALYEMIKITSGVYFQGRCIFFISINLPDKTYVAGTDVSGYQGQICFYIIDEILYENESQLDYAINDDQQIQYIEQIEKNINRGLIAPFGLSFKKMFLFNPWDLNHKICNKVSNKLYLDYRNTSSSYVRKYKHACKELIKGGGMLSAEDDEGIYFAASFNSMSDERKKALQKYYDKDKRDNKSVWLVAYCSIPNLSLDTSLATYWSLDGKEKFPMNKQDISLVEDWTWVIGMDVGTRDDTALFVGRVFSDKLEVVEIYTTNEKTHSEIAKKVEQILDKLRVGDAPIFIDPRGGGSNMILEINSNTKYRALSSSSKSDWKEISFRVARLNQMIFNNSIIIAVGRKDLNIKLFNHLKAIQNYRMDHNKAGERNEKTTRFKLDIINALEYALKYEWRRWNYE